MKKLLLVLLLFSFCSTVLFSQNALLSPKPGILINGNQCLIGNTVHSCETKVCDSIQVYVNDTIVFENGQEIFLNTDTAYYLQWNFNGSSNYPVSILNDYPSSTPVSYSPSWNIPGTYTVDVYYNGWLSAYSYSDCYPFGPSHWTMQVHVLPLLNGIENLSSGNDGFSVYPVPAQDGFTIRSKEPGEYRAALFNDLGQCLLETNFQNEISEGVSTYEAGIYFVELFRADGVSLGTKKIVVTK